jgi:hypothetical protein
MKEYKSIKIFQYGKNENEAFISEGSVNNAIGTFANKPIMIFNTTDKYNKKNLPVGYITKVTKIEFPYVYGDVSIFKDDVKLGKFRNYGVEVLENHTEGDTYYIDKFTLSDVSFDLEEE